jgi:ligand-binding sensor domain-containing protein
MKLPEMSRLYLGFFAIASLSILGCGQNKGQAALKKSPVTVVYSNAKWEQLNSLTDIWFLAVKAIGKDLVAGSYGHGLYRSKDDGRSWQPINQGLPDKASCVGFTVIGDVLFADIYEGKVYRSDDHGDHWIEADSGIANNGTTGFLEHHLIAFGNRLFYCRTFSDIYCSTDSGKSWSKAEAGLPKDFYGFADGFSIIDSVLYAAYDSNEYYRMSADTSEWEAVDSSNTDSIVYSNLGSGFGLSGESKILSALPKLNGTIKNVTGRDNIILIGTTKGLWISRDAGLNWVSSNNGIPPNISFINSTYGGGVFSLMTYEYCEDRNCWGLYYSTDNGSSWTFVGYPEMTIYSMAKSGYYYTATNVGLFRTDSFPTDVQNNIVDGAPVFTVAIKDSLMYIGTIEGAYYSIDKGYTWYEDESLPGDIPIRSIIYKDAFFAGTDTGVFIRDEKSKRWRSFDNGMTSKKVISLSSCGNDLIALCRDSIEVDDEEEGPYMQVRNHLYRSPTTVCKWTAGKSALLDSLSIQAFAVVEKTLFIGTNNGVYYSPDLGDTLISLNAGMPEDDRDVLTLAANKDFLIMGTSRGLYRLARIPDRN